MADTNPFQATTKDYRLSQGEVQRLKKQLANLRQLYVQALWTSSKSPDLRRLTDLEAQIGETEHILAHTTVVH